MIKPTTSWWVPLSSFAIAVALAFLAGPKASLHARPPGAATGCVCELKNLDINSTVDFVDITAKVTYDFNGGLPSNDTITWFDHYGHVVLTVVTAPTVPGGPPGTKTIEADMKAKKAKNNIAAFGVKFTPGSKYDLSCTHKDLDARVRAAAGKLGSGITGEAPGSREPLDMHVNVHAETKEKGGKITCSDDITNTFSTNIDLLGNGTGHGNTP